MAKAKHLTYDLDAVPDHTVDPDAAQAGPLPSEVDHDQALEGVEEGGGEHRDGVALQANAQCIVQGFLGELGGGRESFAGAHNLVPGWTAVADTAVIRQHCGEADHDQGYEVVHDDDDDDDDDRRMKQNKIPTTLHYNRAQFYSSFTRWTAGGRRRRAAPTGVDDILYWNWISSCL